MNSSVEIRVPRETVNDDTVTIVAWHRAHGEKVRSRDPVASIETSKAVLEVEAEGDGYLETLFAKGAEVPVGELIGWLRPSPPTGNAPGGSGSAGAPIGVASRAVANGTAAGASGASGTVSFSKKAKALIDEHELDPALFSGRGLVREADVLAMIEGRAGAASSPGATTAAAGTQAPPEIPPAGLGESRAQPPAAPASGAAGSSASAAVPHAGGLFGDARDAAKGRGKGVLWLVFNYVWRTWFLGNLVRTAPRGLDLFIHRLRGVKMGRDCFIDPSAIVETAYPENITMGNDVRITAGCVIMTHIKAPHYLRNTGIMPAVLKPVVLEDACFIGVNSVVMPGVTVGRAAVVASGSVVVANVPAYTMVAGNPAKVIKHFPRPEEPAPPTA